MARRSAADTAETHEQIIKKASQTFMARGSAVGIGEVMKEVGMTRGGFYRHFESKDHLLVEAVGKSFMDVGNRLEAIAEAAPKGKQLEAIIRAYLSMEHVVHPEAWCALAAMADDLGRQSATVRKRTDAALRLYMERMAKYLPGRTAQEQRKNFVLLFSGMAGAVSLARALGDAGMREGVLAMSLEHYLSWFAPATPSSRNEFL
jgi:TetR/AcrR family transcriptional repressor of nem operon